MKRLGFVVACVALVATSCVLPSPAPGTALFPNGVASGDVTSTTAVVWVRTSAPARVKLKVFPPVLIPGTATFTAGPKPVFTASASTTAANDNVAKVTATGLSPLTNYFFRWKSGAEYSQQGRFMTAPDPNQNAGFNFVVAADADGFPVGGPPAFNSFETLDRARFEQPAFFSFLGDTIYSDSSFAPGPAMTLDDYRAAHAQNRSFAALRNLMSATGTYAQPDDHEVYNDYDGETVAPARYAAGWRAFHDWMPTDPSNVLADPNCAGSPRYFHQKWGTQAEIFQLDERSCRSDQNPVKVACTSGTTLDLAPTAPSGLRTGAGLPPAPPPNCLTAINDPTRTFLGSVQKARFEADLLASTAKWKIVLSQDAIQQFYALPYDRWEGYGAERSEVLNHIRGHDIANVVFLTTDLHANIYGNVFMDKTTDSTPIAYEAISGPIATNTYKNEIINSVGASYVGALQLVLTLQGVDCQSIDTYSYQLVQVSSSGTLTISSKDKDGNVVGNDTNPSIKCKKVLGP